MQLLLASADSLHCELLGEHLRQHGYAQIERVHTVSQLRCLHSPPQADLTIADLLMGGDDLLDWLSTVSAVPAHRPIIVRVVDTTPYPLLRALLATQNSRTSFVHAQDGLPALNAALATVQAGVRLLSPTVRRLHAQARRLALSRTLTPREIDVVTRLAARLSTREIAAELRLAIETIDDHRKNAARKLGVHSQAEMLGLLFDLGLARPRLRQLFGERHSHAAPPNAAGTEDHTPPARRAFRD